MAVAELDDPVDRALAHYFESQDRGAGLSESQLIASFPECVEELKRFFDAQRQLSAQVEGLELEFSKPKTETFGRFQIERKLGAGAFGTVWLAYDPNLSRRVALKTLHARWLNSEEQDRLLREGRIVAQLNHPNLVRVFDLGLHDGQPYLVSEVVDGVSLSEQLASGVTPSIRESATICAFIGDALHHAHEAGVVHRDLKPSNVLIDAVGQPRLTDFGLARHDAAEVTMTLSGQVLGTPAYMSPEQAAGGAHEADRRSDVYSLGVLLFELLTGERPFRGNLQAILHQVINEDPPSPRRYNRQTPRDLETVVLKCLEKDPSRRYQTAREAGDELRRFLANEPIAARPVGMFGKGWRWARRRPAVAALSTAVASLVVATVVILAVSNARVRQGAALTAAALEQKSKALKEKEVALGEREAALATARDNQAKERRRYYAAQMNLASQAWKDGRLARTAQLLETLRPTGDEPDLRGFEWRHLYHLCNANVVRRWRGHATAIFDAVWSPEGDWFATVSNDGYVRLWDALTGELQTQFATNEDAWYGYRDIAVDAAGKTLVTLRGNGEIRVWDVAERRTKHRWLAGENGGHPGFLALSSNGDVVVASCKMPADEPPSIKIWRIDGNEPELVYHFPAENGPIELSPDGKLIVTAPIDDAADKKLTAWNLDDMQVSKVAEIDGVGATALRFSPDGQTLWAACHPAFTDGNSLREIDAESWKVRRSYTGHSDAVQGLDLAMQQGRAATSSADRTVRVWDTSSGESEIVGYELAQVHAAAISPDGRRVVCTDLNGWIALRDLQAQPEFPVISANAARGDGGPINCMAFSADGRRLHVGADQLRTFDVAAPTSVLSETSGKALALNPENQLVAFYQPEQKQIEVKNFANDKLAASFKAGEVSHAVFSPSGELLASWMVRTNDWTMPIWSVLNGEQVNELNMIDVCFLSAAFSPDSKQIVVGERNERFGIYDMQKGLVDYDSVAVVGVAQCVYSPDRARLAVGCEDGTLVLYDCDGSTGQVSIRARLEGHTLGIQSLAFTPDSVALISASADGTLRFWDTTTCQERATFEKPANNIVVSPNGIHLAAADVDGNITLLRASVLAEASTPRPWVGRTEANSPLGMIYNAHIKRRDGDPAGGDALLRAADEVISQEVVAQKWTPELVEAYLNHSRFEEHPDDGVDRYLQRADEISEQRLRNVPDEDASYLVRARTLARLARWPEGIDCLRRALKVMSGSAVSLVWHQAAVRFLEEGKLNEFTTTFELMAGRLGETGSGEGGYHYAWTAVLAPQSTLDLSAMLNRARSLRTAPSASPQIELLFTGLLLRCGEFEEADKLLEDAVQRYERDEGLKVYLEQAEVFLAMTKWRLGRRKEAIERLASAKARSNARLRGGIALEPLTFRILHREADDLITNRK